jgi:hypothetical protein
MASEAIIMVITASLSFMIGLLLSLRWDIFVLLSVIAGALPVVALIGFACGEDAGSIVVELVVTIACMEAGFMAKLFVVMLTDAARLAITKMTRSRRLRSSSASPSHRATRPHRRAFPTQTIEDFRFGATQITNIRRRQIRNCETAWDYCRRRGWESREVALPRTCYSIERLEGKWVILVSGAKLLTCPKKSIALGAVRRAKVLLLQQSSTDVATEPHNMHEGHISAQIRWGTRRRFQLEKRSARSDK